jgi:hypothetical protein
MFMHRFWGHFFDLKNITLRTSNFELIPLFKILNPLLIPFFSNL